MKPIYYILIVAVAVLLFFLIGFMSSRLKKNKIIDKFNNFFAKVRRKEEVVMALNNYESVSDLTEYLVRIEDVCDKERHIYIKELKGRIVFGRNFSKSQVCIYEPKADDMQFCIFLDRNIPYISSLSDKYETIVKIKKKHGRNVGKKFALRNSERMEVFTGDEIYIGARKYILTIWHRKKGIR